MAAPPSTPEPGPGQVAQPGPDLAAAKTALRDQLITARNRRSLAEVGQASADLARVLLASDPIRSAAVVAAYVSIGTEPGTGLLLDALYEAGKRVLLPITTGGLSTGDLDLDWAAYAGPGSLARARFGLLEPETPPLGREAIVTADVVLVPGLACSATGFRIGKGGGCYDRALARVPVGTFTCLLAYDDEVGVSVPLEPHDRPVLAVATPSGIRTLGPAPR